MNNNSFLSGFGAGVGWYVAGLLIPLIPLLVVGGGIYLLCKFMPEEASECENGQQQK